MRLRPHAHAAKEVWNHLLLNVSNPPAPQQQADSLLPLGGAQRRPQDPESCLEGSDESSMSLPRRAASAMLQGSNVSSVNALLGPWFSKLYIEL